MHKLIQRICLFSIIAAFSSGAWMTTASASTYYVSPGQGKAAGHGAGTADQPYKSMGAALKRLKPGDRLLLKPGVYRTSIDLRQSVLGKGGKATSSEHGLRTTIEGERAGSVVIKGSDEVSGWRALGNGMFVHDEWKVNSEQVFVDGAPMQQIGGTIMGGYPEKKNHPMMRIQLGGGGIWPGRVAGNQNNMPVNSFYYDAAASRLYLRVRDTKLSGHRVEVSVRPYLVIGSDIHDLTLKNIRFEHANTSSVSQSGAISIRGDRLILDHINVDNVDMAGFDISGNDNIVRNSSASHCGQVGLKVRGKRAKVLDNVFSFNNTRGFNKWWEAGGAKFVGQGGLQDSEVAGNKSYANNGDGIWFDWLNDNNRIHNNISAYNKGFGIQYEASQRAQIYDNYIFANAQRGIYLPNSRDSVIAHNLVADNGLQGIAIVDARRGQYGKFDLTPRGNKVFGNIIAWNKGPAVVLPADAPGNRSDYNLVVSGPGAPAAFSLGWGSLTQPVRHGLSAWQNASKQDEHSKVVKLNPPPGFLQAVDKRELRPNWSVLLDAGKKLRTDVSAGRNAGGVQPWAGPAS